MIIEKIAMAALENYVMEEMEKWAALNPFSNPAFRSAAMNGAKAGAKKSKQLAQPILKNYGKPIGDAIKGMGESVVYTAKHPGKVLKSFNPGGNQKIRNKGMVAASTVGGIGALGALAAIARGERK